MSNSYRHFYLYAKNWYERKDVMEDLRAITARWCGVHFDHVTEHDAVLALSHAAERHIDFARFMTELMDNMFFFKEDNAMISLSRAMLSFLLKAEVKDIPFDLGAPDQSVLPLRGEKE